MNISNYYWYFSGVLTPKFCDDVIEYANSQKEVMAITGGYGDRELNKIIRIHTLQFVQNLDYLFDYSLGNTYQLMETL